MRPKNIAISVICNEIGIILMIGTKAAVKSFQLKILVKNIVQNSSKLYCPCMIKKGSIGKIINRSKTPKPKIIFLFLFIFILFIKESCLNPSLVPQAFVCERLRDSFYTTPTIIQETNNFFLSVKYLFKLACFRYKISIKEFF